MAWIEFQKDVPTGDPRVGRKLKAGTKIDYPYHAAQALVRSGCAVFCSEPVRGEAPEPPETPDGSEGEGAPDEGKGEEPEKPDEGYPDPVAFKALDVEDQKALARMVGIDKDCDLRKPASIVIAYAAWYGDNEEG